MAATTFFRKKALTAEEFFKRFGQSIPLYRVDFDKREAQAHTPAGGAIAVYFTNDENVADYFAGPKRRTEITCMLQAEETGWQAITIENYGAEDGLALLDRAHKLLTDKFGAISQYDIEYPIEDKLESAIDFDNLPPEMLSLDPNDPLRAWFLYNATPEEREEAMRIYESDERARQESAKRYAQYERRQEELRRQNLLHPKPKKRRTARRM